MAALKSGGAVARPTPASEFLPGTPFWAPPDASDPPLAPRVPPVSAHSVLAMPATWGRSLGSLKL